MVVIGSGLFTGGYIYKIELDLQNFFDEISLEELMNLLEQHFTDLAVLHLFQEFLFCGIS